MKIIRPIFNFYVLVIFLCFSTPIAHAAVSSFSDDFNRTSLGPDWTVAKGSFGIDNQTLFQWTGGNDGGLTVNAALTGNDYDLEMDTFYTDAMAARGLVARYQDIANYYYGKVGRNGDAAIIKVQGGVKTTLGLYDGPWLTQNTWHRIRFRVEGTSLKLYLDGVLRLQVQDSTFNSGKAGIWADSYYVRFDNFSLIVLNSTPPVAPPTVNSVPEFVASDQLTLSGTKSANTSIWINGAQAVPIDASTAWSAQMALPQDGLHFFQITAKDGAGTESVKVTVSTTRDRTAPTVSFTTPADRSVVPEAGFMIQGTAHDVLSGVEEVRVYIDDYGRPGGCNGHATRTVNHKLADYDPATGTWSFQVLGEYVTPGSEAVIQVMAKDKAGNWSQFFSRTVVVYATPPNPPTVTALPEFTSASSIALSGTKEANTSIWINSAEAVPLNSSTSWSVVITLSQEGVNQVSIMAKNSSGVQSNPVSLSTKLDLSPPVLVITAPLNGETVSADGFRITGTAVDQVSGVEDVRVSITVERRSGCEREIVTTVNNALANFDPQTGVWFFDVLSAHIIPGRQAFISVTGRDKLSHSATKTAQVIVGQFEPITGSISIANGTSYTKSAAVTIQLTRSANVVQMSLSQNSVAFPPPEAFSDTKPWTLTGTDGVKSIFVKFFNTNGRSSQIYSDQIILDTTPPDVILISSTMTNQVQYALTYTVDGTQGQENVTLTDGENVIDRTFSDLAGNETQVSWRVTLDRTIPVVTGPSEIFFTPNGDLNQDTAQITGQISENTDWKIEILDSSQTILKSFQGTGNSFDVIWDGINPFDNQPYPDGTYTAKATAKDTALNEANPLSITITLSTSQEIERIFIYAGDKRIAMEENGEKFFILSDHLGSSIVHVDNSGNEVSHTEYKSFGGVKSETSTKTFNKKFTGKELDESTGLYDYEARQYDANIGRFITADPLMWDDATLKKVDGKGLQEFLADPQNLNRYSYTLNNPLKYKDSSGKKVELAEKRVAGFGVHRFLILTPDNPVAFVGNPRFVRDNRGNLITTVSGQPEYGLAPFGKLVGRPNSDLKSKILGKAIVKSPAGISDTEFIKGILFVESLYGNNLNYDLIPEISSGYNSNSYTRGILGTVGVSNPPKLSGRFAPGFNKPISIMGAITLHGLGSKNGIGVARTNSFTRKTNRRAR